MHTRRRFLGHTGVALTASSQLGWLASNARAGLTDDYCAMVCILLAGGADSFNMLVPADTDRYATYASVRSDLALAQEDLLPLSYTGTGGQNFGVHPGLTEVQQLFDGGDLAFVSNIGPLAAPTSRIEYDQASVPLPLGLFSHADQIAVWQTAAAGGRLATGVGGRIADLVQPQVNAGPVSMNISMSGTNLFQTGNDVASYAIDASDGVRSLAGYGDIGNEAFSSAVDALLANEYADPFRATYAGQLRDAIDSGAELSQALDAAPVLNTNFSIGGLSEALAQIARVISVRDLLGVQRQTFFVTVGGWDHHDEVLNNQARMLPGISRGLSEFHSALTEMGILDGVTTFTISDFGRTLTSNGRGSDHGWGGHNMVMGGAVNGGEIYGQYPDLTPGTDLDLGRGRFLPTTSIDEFYAELALWFGVAASDLDQVLPNIGRFYAPTSSPPPLGFLNVV
jgi:uncharacterized protein (DUF1501 family)